MANKKRNRRGSEGSQAGKGAGLRKRSGRVIENMELSKKRSEKRTGNEAKNEAKADFADTLSDSAFSLYHAENADDIKVLAKGVATTSCMGFAAHDLLTAPRRSVSMDSRQASAPANG